MRARRDFQARTYSLFFTAVAFLMVLLVGGVTPGMETVASANATPQQPLAGTVAPANMPAGGYGSIPTDTPNATTNTATLKMSIAVNGGTATAADWQLVAYRVATGGTGAAGSIVPPPAYLFNNAQSRSVPRVSDYRLAAIPVGDESLTRNYLPTLSCAVGSVTPTQMMVWLPNAAGQSADCTVTMTYTTSNVKTLRISASVLRDDANAYLVGTRFRLHDVWTFGEGQGTRPPLSPTAWSCEITSGNACDISLPTSGLSRQFAVVVEATNASTFVTSTMVGSYPSPQSPGAGVPLYYAGITRVINSSMANVVSFPTEFWDPVLTQNATGSFTNKNLTSSWYRRGDRVVTSLNNPDRNIECAPPTIAIQLDKSASIVNDGTVAEREAYRNALLQLISDAKGTGTRISLFTFGYVSPVRGLANREVTGLQNVDVPAQATVLENAINSWFTNRLTNPREFTNWDLALRRVADVNRAAAPADKYDHLLFITDGTPNGIKDPSGTGYWLPDAHNTAILSMEEAIRSANDLKHQGVRVITFGMGSGASGDAIAKNLEAISGQTRGEDFFQGGWGDLNVAMKAVFEQALCDIPVTVIKETGVPEAWTPTNGWDVTMAATSTTPPMTMVPSAGTQTTHTVNGQAGRADWKLQFERRDAQASITVGEIIPAGSPVSYYEGGYVIRHRDNTQSTGALTGPLDQTIPNLNVGDRVEVVFRNLDVPPTIEKTSSAGEKSEFDDVVTYTVKLKNEGPNDFTTQVPVAFTDDLSEVLDDATWNDDATVSFDMGTTVVSPPAFDAATQRLTWSGPLRGGETATFTYSVTLNDAGDRTVHNVACIDGVADACAETTTNLPPSVNLTIEKSANRTSLPTSTQNIDYTVIVTNHGPAAATVATPAVVVDDLSEVLDDATFTSVQSTQVRTGTGSWTNTTAAVFNAADKTVTWSGPLEVDQQIRIVYRLSWRGTGLQTLGGSGHLYNIACIPEDLAQDPALHCDDVNISGPNTTWKSSDPASGTELVGGDEVTYTLNFRQTAGAFTTWALDYTDHLSDVLDDAELVPGSIVASHPSMTTVFDPVEQVLSIGGSIATGFSNNNMTHTVSYTVKVKPDGARGDDVMANFLMPKDSTPPEECVPAGNELPNCTTHPIEEPDPSIFFIEKHDADDALIGGAGFEINRDDAGAVGALVTTPEIVDHGVDPLAPVPGRFSVTGLPAGAYWLTETVSPDGYTLLAEPVPFSLAGDGTITVGGDNPQVTASTNGDSVWVITVRDNAALPLPFSGGYGTLLFTAGGVALVLVAFAMLYANPRRKPETTSHTTP